MHGSPVLPEPRPRRGIGFWPVALVVLVIAVGWMVVGGSRSAAVQTPVSVPVAAVDETPGTATTEVAVLAGGCFWGVQGVFQHVDGVISAVSGYAGGEADSAHYDLVGTGTTGHAESVAVTFDPRRISYGTILRLYFAVAHDPTQLNRQGPDVGSQYRSTIFPVSADQIRIAQAYIDQLERGHVFGDPIVTTIEPDRTFYPAEEYHQDFMVRNPTYAYIVVNDAPKVEALERDFPDLYRADPVLVLSAAG